MVPKDRPNNLEWRKYLVRKARKDPEFQTAQWIMCKRDPLYYINSYVWTFNPKDEGRQSRVPFIMYPFQEKVFWKILNALGNKDLIINKSRDMGATWLCLLSFLYEWHFIPGVSFLLGSRKEEYVDKLGDPKSLFWKLNYTIKKFPPWLRPNFRRKKLSLVNLDIDSTIDGESNNPDFGRGDRRRAALIDEAAAWTDGQHALAATADTTNCRIINSTPQGTGNIHYMMWMKLPESQRIEMWWHQHPVKGHEKKKAVTTRSRWTSPWFEKECIRRSPQEVAQELELDFLGSDYQFFDQSVLDGIARNDCREPLRRGDIDYEPITLRPLAIVERREGPLAMWTPRPEEDEEFVIGIDISTGTGASESVASVGSRKTQEKVAEFVTRNRKPDVFAQICVALAKYYNNAFLIWEANGPGREFGLSVIETGYRHIYYKKHEQKLAPKVSDIPGWHSTKDTKNLLLGEYRGALSSGKYKNRSAEAIRQCGEYIFLEDQGVAHARSQANLGDPTSLKANHGDRVIADALCWRGLKTRMVIPSIKKETPKNSFAWRREQHRKLQKQKVMW